MTQCVIYSFWHVARRPRSKDELPATLVVHTGRAREFAERRGFQVSERSFVTLQTNRDRHFASTSQFREAVRLAKEVNGPLIVGDLFELLCATHPDMASDALTAVIEAGIVAYDARSGARIVRDAKMSTMLKTAIAVGLERRAPIQRGLARRQGAPASPPTSNQAAAAKGARRAAANDFEIRLRPAIEAIYSALPTNATMTRAHLAKELNAQQVLTRQGKAWTPANAGKLLARLKDLRPR